MKADTLVRATPIPWTAVQIFIADMVARVSDTNGSGAKNVKAKIEQMLPPTATQAG